MSDERRKQFLEFIAKWKAENVTALIGQHIDPSDRKYLIRERAKRLESEARELGLLSCLHDDIGIKSNVQEYVNDLFEAADFRKRAGIG